MKLSAKVIAAFSVFAFVAGGAFGASDTATQSLTLSVAEMAVIDVTGNPGTLQLVAPATGGETPAAVNDNTTYAQYTSTVPSGQTRTITAEFGGGDSLPAGTVLTLTAAPGTDGGTTAGTVTMSSSAQNILTAIGSVATGTGATDGAQLTYELSVGTMTSLVAGESQNITVTLTLTDPA